MSERLEQGFYGRGAQVVAADLLGKRLVRLWHGRRLSGIIVETEAYCDADEPDLACHGDRANGGRPTARTAVMFGEPGYAYVYFTYGMHWMFNVVTGQVGQANAVLIRALVPDEGWEVMRENRNGRPRIEWTNGPDKLAQELGIDK
jgi:DNA-3-methyladenine glycosylase